MQKTAIRPMTSVFWISLEFSNLRYFVKLSLSLIPKIPRPFPQVPTFGYKTAGEQLRPAFEAQEGEAKLQHGGARVS